MSRNTRSLESPATTEENNYDYRVEWNDHLFYNYKTETLEHNGSGARYYYNDFDGAWDCFCDLRRNPDYIGLRLIQIRSDGSEFVRDSK